MQMAGGSLPRHSFPLISSQGRDTREPDAIQTVEGGRWAGLSWWGKLTDSEPESLSAILSGLFSGSTISGHLGCLHTG